MRPGREWEILVAQLETLFAGPGFKVRSPENIRSRRTGNVVKVDVAVRGKVGTQDILIAFECRDREDRQGVDWIQQLSTRKQDIGASELIAVSRDGFTADAIREAEACGIPLRTLSKVSPDELASLVLGVRLEIQRPQYRATQIDLSHLSYHQFGIDPLHADEWPSLTSQVLEEILAKPYEPTFLDQQMRRSVSIADMVVLADWDSAFTGEVHEDKREHCAYLPTEYVDSWGMKSKRFELWLEDDCGIRLSRFAFLGEVWWRSEQVPLSAVMHYVEDSRTLATIAEFDLKPHGFSEKLKLFFDGYVPGPD